MRALNNNLRLTMAAVAAALSFGLGCWYSHWMLWTTGAVCLGYLAAQWTRYRRGMALADDSTANAAEAWAHPPEVLHRKPIDPSDTVSLVEGMLAQKRYALLLRPQIAANLDEDPYQRALAALEDGMALVPDGEVVIGQVDDNADEGQFTEEELSVRRGHVVRVEHFFLDRFPVTNRQYYEFVAAGGYQQVSLWEPSILPAVLDFVDQTGAPGPRYWRNGCYDPQHAEHPVVGVSWYEASAYARWTGKRLPTDAEWVKAASWPVSVTATTRVQRRYPWGDSMDRSRAQLWGSKPRGTAAVDTYANGVSVGGVYHLIGNVWEWTRGNFVPPELPGELWLIDVPMRSIRGGAFDTYFDNQATCQFQSGEAAIARKHNIGFRCAVGVCDLVLARSAEGGGAEIEEEQPTAMEVGA